MDSYSSTTSNTDSSSSASYSFSSTQFLHHYHLPPPAFQSAQHTVGQYATKNAVMKKLPIAPLPPTPPKVYKVEPIDFKDVVQKLTGAIEFQPRRLREVAPPPLSLSPPHRNSGFREEDDGVGKRQKTFDANFGALSPLGFTLSPTSLAWCKAVLLSPGTIASFEPSLVL